MGRDKAFILVDGDPLARRTALTLQAAGCAPVHLVGNQPPLDTLGFPTLREPETGRRHPLYGVAAGLSAGHALSLFVPCDLPRLTDEAVRRLLSAGAPCRAAGQPLLCVLPAGLAARALSLAEEGAPVRALVGHLPAVPLPDEALHNANRPADLG